MVLVGVGEDEAGKVVAAVDDEARVGHLHIDPRQARIAEDDAEIDHQPGAIVAVEIEVHADFAGAAERNEEKIPLARSEEHTSELQSLMRISYAVFCLTKKQAHTHHQ